jgi:hypothetical protein
MSNQQPIVERVEAEINLVDNHIDLLREALSNGNDIPEHPPLAIANVLDRAACALTNTLTTIDNREAFENEITRALATAWYLGELMTRTGHPIGSLQQCLCFEVDDEELKNLLSDG